MKNFNFRSIYYEEKDGCWYNRPLHYRVRKNIEDSIDVARHQGEVIKVWVGVILVHVAGDSDLDLLCRDYERAMKEYIPREIGPYPNSILSKEEEESDRRIGAEREMAELTDRWMEQDHPQD